MSVAVSPADGLAVSVTLPANPLTLFAAMVVAHTVLTEHGTLTGADGLIVKSCTVSVALPLLPVWTVSPP